MRRCNVREPNSAILFLYFGIRIPLPSTGDVTNSAPAAMNVHRAPV